MVFCQLTSKLSTPLCLRPYTSPSTHTHTLKKKKISGMAKLKERFFHYFQVSTTAKLFPRLLVHRLRNEDVSFFHGFTDGLFGSAAVKGLQRPTLFAVVRGTQGQDSIITHTGKCELVRVTVCFLLCRLPRSEYTEINIHAVCFRFFHQHTYVVHIVHSHTERMKVTFNLLIYSGYYG